LFIEKVKYSRREITGQPRRNAVFRPTAVVPVAERFASSDMIDITHFVELAIGTVIALLPVTNPPASAPAFLAVTLGLASLAKTWVDYAAIATGIVVVAVIAYAVLRLSASVVAFVGMAGMNALTKVMGFLLLCIGIQFIVNGVLGIATDPVIVRSIRDAAGSPR